MQGLPHVSVRGLVTGGNDRIAIANLHTAGRRKRTRSIGSACLLGHPAQAPDRFGAGQTT